jgi:HEAT repeat protein
MKHFLICTALLAGATLGLQGVSNAHGGTYRGPGDTVPPGGGGGGGGGPGPSTPGPSAPGPSTPGPSSPGPSTPGPSTGGPAAGPRGPSTGPAASGPDLTLWEFWWGFNKDKYLNLKEAIHSGGVSSGTDEFFNPGAKDKAKNALKPSEETIRNKVVPALKEALEKERANDIIDASLIALAKIGDVRTEDGSSEFEPILSKFLGDSSQQIAETAAVSLGILANEASIEKLKSLMLDTPDGRKLVGSNQVAMRTRAFAAYGLGLIGARTTRNESRQTIMKALVELIDKPDMSQPDVKVGAMLSIGLVPIDNDSGEGGDATDPSASRQAQLKWLKRYFGDGNKDYRIRAHAPTSMAKLLAGASPEEKQGVAKLLVEAIGKNSKERDVVQQTCVLALGILGDSDKDKIDAEIREALKRISDDGELQAKNFAMIALGQVGGRPGQGEGNEDGQKECRNFLLTQLTKGKNHLKPWAGIAVGVMERALLDAGLTPSATAKENLREALKDSGSPESVGAYSIACGIAKDLEAKEILLQKFEKTGDDNTKGHIAVAIGMIEARDAIPVIQKVVLDSKYKPDLLKQTAVALGLLGDKELVPELVTLLGNAKSLASQAAIASGLGFIGDSRSIDPLVAMLKKKEGLTDTARGFSAVALGIVCDKELLPWNAKLSADMNYRASVSTLQGEGGTGILDIL